MDSERNLVTERMDEILWFQFRREQRRPEDVGTSFSSGSFTCCPLFAREGAALHGRDARERPPFSMPTPFFPSRDFMSPSGTAELERVYTIQMAVSAPSLRCCSDSALLHSLGPVPQGSER